MPAVASTIRKLPQPGRALLDASGETAPAALAPGPTVVAPPLETPTPAVTPVAPERYKAQFTISRETQEKLCRVQALARHAIPSGDLPEIFDRGLTLLLQGLERRRCAAVTSPRMPRGVVDRSRHIPASVKREVWRRDDGRCAYIGRDGRCTERGFLEYHHVQPYAAGGAATVTNIELPCRAHNAYEASLFFGLEREHAVQMPITE
jgi:hypothetical protein